MSDVIENTEQAEMVLFFKAVANVERLKILGLLAVRPYTLSELAETLKMKPVLVAKHVSLLNEFKLVKENAGNYRLDEVALQALSRRMLENSRPQARPEDFEGEDFERKVLSDFFTADHQLKSFPTQQKKLLVVLRHVAKIFEVGARYTEKQVNDLLRPIHPDTASLRRYLVDNELLKRDKSIYWKE